MLDMDRRPALMELLAARLPGLRQTEVTMHRLDLEGFATETAEFVSQPSDVVLEDRPSVGRAVKRTILLALYEGQEEIQKIASVACVLVHPLGPGPWSLFAASDIPWTVELARQLVEANFQGTDGLFDRSQTIPFGRVMRLVGRADDEMAVLATGQARIPGVLAHAQSRVMLRQHERILGPAALALRGLLHIGVYDDPDSRWRKYYGARSPVLNPNSRTLMPPVGGMRLVLPLEYPKAAVPKDFPLTLSKQESANQEVVDAWLERCAGLILHPDYARSDVAMRKLMHIEPKLARDLAVDKSLAVFAELVAQRERNTELIRDLKELVEEGERLVKQEEKRDEYLQQVRAKLGESEREMFTLRAQLRDATGELEAVRALDPRALQAQLDAAVMELEATRGELADRTEENAVLREQFLTMREQPEAVAPRAWPELFQLAGVFRYVDVPDWAVAPVYGTLDRGQGSLGWLVRAWAVLAKLEEYAAAKAAGATGPVYANFRTYVAEFPAPGVTPNHVKLGESEVVRANPELRSVRMFPTPMGPRLFEEHVSIGSDAPPAPRLHYFDDTSESGLVYVGYIGPHLRNTRTN